MPKPKQPTLREMLTGIIARQDALEERLASPAVAVEPASGNTFIAFLTSKHERDIKAGTHVRCEVPGCSGVMNVGRTTTLKGKRACRRHF